jgi:hypothetical protein
VEIRAGTGGDEAALFAGDLYQMYTHYARDQGWRVEDISFSPGEQGGFKEAVFRALIWSSWMSSPNVPATCTPTCCACIDLRRESHRDILSCFPNQGRRQVPLDLLKTLDRGDILRDGNSKRRASWWNSPRPRQRSPEMPLLDHFHPPLSKRRHWENMHSAWANALRDQLNAGLLPPRYVAEVQITVGTHVEMDVGTFDEERNGAPGESGDNVTVWAPPRPPQTVPLNFTHPELFEVQVLTDEEGPQVVAAIELIGPGNKDRSSNRHVFAVKCGSYLQQGINLVIVDVVTERSGNLHADLLCLLEVSPKKVTGAPTDLYAVAYRTVPTKKAVKLEFWPETLTLGTPLPTVPLWIRQDLCLPLDLERAYQAACSSSRIR